MSAAALVTLSGLALAPSAQAAPDTATFEIGTIYRLDSGATENAGEAQPQPHGYDTYVTFAAGRLPDGTAVDASQVYTISGGDYTSVTVPADATMPTQVYPRSFGANGAPTSFITLYGLNEGLWHGGGFPAGSSWNADGRWVGPNGQPTAFVGGTGGYMGSAPWVAPVDGERVTLVDKYYSVDITKTFDDGSDPSGRIFYSANGADPVNSSRHFAWETGADGTARGWWMAGWFSQVWEYLSPAEVAAGMTGVSLASDYGWGQDSLTAPIPTRTLTAADLAAIDANPYAPQATRDLVSRFEVGGVLIGPVAVHSTHPATFVTVTAVNRRTPTEPRVKPTIALDIQQCVASDGSSSVPGATTDAADGSTVTMSDGTTTASSLVTHDAFTAEHVRPAVDYTFTVTDGDRTASVHATFPVCPPPPTEKPTTPPTTPSTTPPAEKPAQPAAPTTSRTVVQHKKPATPPRAARHSALATTGASVGVALAIAAGTLAAGIALTSVRRRKNNH